MEGYAEELGGMAGSKLGVGVEEEVYELKCGGKRDFITKRRRIG